jgi:hypothetical protein
LLVAPFLLIHHCSASTAAQAKRISIKIATGPA